MFFPTNGRVIVLGKCERTGKLGVYTHNSSTRKLRQVFHEVEISLGYIMRPYTRERERQREIA